MKLYIKIHSTVCTAGLKHSFCCFPVPFQVHSSSTPQHLPTHILEEIKERSISWSGFKQNLIVFTCRPDPPSGSQSLSCQDSCPSGRDEGQMKSFSCAKAEYFNTRRKGQEIEGIYS